MADNFDKIRGAIGLSEQPRDVEMGFNTKPNPIDPGVIFKPRADGTIVRPTQMPTRMAMKIGISDNKLTLEFEKEVGFMQFDKADAWNFVKTLTQYARTIT